MLRASENAHCNPQLDRRKCAEDRASSSYVGVAGGQHAQHWIAGRLLAALSFHQAGIQAARLSRESEASQGQSAPAVPLVLLQHHAEGIILSQGVLG